MINLLHRLTKWLEHSICGKTPKVVKQIRHQGFVSKEDLCQLVMLESDVAIAWPELSKLAERKADIYTFEYVLEKRCGIKLSDIKEQNND